MTARLALLGILVVCASCADLRGRRRVREGNRLFREGLYAQALEHYRAAETLVPEFPLLWLNEGLTCRQLMIPGAKTPENDRATDCAIQAFERLHGPRRPARRQLQVQTLLDADRFEILERMYGERLRANPADLAAMNGLIHVQSRAGKLDEALACMSAGRRCKQTTPRPSMRSACSCGRSCSGAAAARSRPRSTRAQTRPCSRR